jgi:hypothetical protein
MKHISIISVIVGILFLVGGYFLYPHFEPGSSTFFSTKSIGIAILVPLGSVKKGSQFNLDISGIDTDTLTAEVKLYVYIQLDKSPSERPFQMNLSILHEVRGVETSSMQFDDLTGRRTKYSYNPSEDRSLISVNLTGISSSSVGITITFTWAGCLYRRDYSEFLIMIPFDLDPYSGLPSSQPLLPQFFENAYVAVSLPNDSAPTGLHPQIEYTTFYTNRIWYLWNLTEATPGSGWSSSAVWMTFESSTKTREMENGRFWSGLVLGLGLSSLSAGVLSLLEIRLLGPTAGGTSEDTDCLV